MEHRCRYDGTDGTSVLSRPPHTSIIRATNHYGSEAGRIWAGPMEHWGGYDRPDGTLGRLADGMERE
jgi:hypothetical protein